jgi:hypothetical protein
LFFWDFGAFFGFAYSPYFLAVSALLKPAQVPKLAEGKGYGSDSMWIIWRFKDGDKEYVNMSLPWPLLGIFSFKTRPLSTRLSRCSLKVLWEKPTMLESSEKLLFRAR